MSSSSTTKNRLPLLRLAIACVLVCAVLVFKSVSSEENVFIVTTDVSPTIHVSPRVSLIYEDLLKAEKPVEIKKPHILFTVIENSCCWFFTKRKNAYFHSGFTFATKQYPSFHVLNHKHNVNFDFMMRQYRVIVCLNRFNCWDENLYNKFEAYNNGNNKRVSTNRILQLKETLTVKDSFCRSLNTGIASYEITEKISFICFDALTKEAMRPFVEDRPTTTFIVKPANLQGGKNIFLTDGSKLMNNISQLDYEYVVQTYLPNPLLINKRKFDVRVHCIITSVKPLRIYMHPNAFIRFAATDYSENNRSSFLTNLAVGYKLTSTDELTLQLKDFLHMLQNNSFETNLNADVVVNPKKILRDLQNVISLNILSAQAGFTAKCTGCFQTIGIDVILTDKLEPKVIEVNGNPTLDFSTAKCNLDARRFQHGVVKLLFDQQQDKYDYKVANQWIREELSNSKAGIMLDNFTNTEFEYLMELERENRNIRLKRLSFAQIYPPVIHAEEADQWDAFVTHWNVPEQRKQLHRKLVAWENIKAEICIHKRQQDPEITCRTDVLLLDKLYPT